MPGPPWQARQLAAKISTMQRELSVMTKDAENASQMKADQLARKRASGPNAAQPAPKSARGKSNADWLAQKWAREQAPRVANATVSPPNRAPWYKTPAVPWECVTGACKPAKGSTPCEMRHSSSHLQCNRCGAIPPWAPATQGAKARRLELRSFKGLPAAPTLTNESDVVEMDITSNPLDQSLDAIVTTHIIAGPDVASLFLALEVPTQRVKTQKEGVDEVKAELEQAEDDLLAAHGVLAHAKKRLAPRRDELVERRENLQSDVQDLTFVEADKRIADAIAAHQAWSRKSQSHKDRALERVVCAQKGIDDSIAALTMQRKAITDLHQNYSVAWDRINHAVEIEKSAAIRKLEDRCAILVQHEPQAAGGPEAAPVLAQKCASNVVCATDHEEVVELRSMVLELKKMLEAQGELMASAQTKYDRVVLQLQQARGTPKEVQQPPEQAAPASSILSAEGTEAASAPDFVLQLRPCGCDQPARRVPAMHCLHLLLRHHHGHRCRCVWNLQGWLLSWATRHPCKNTGDMVLRLWHWLLDTSHCPRPSRCCCQSSMFRWHYGSRSFRRRYTNC